MIGSLLQALLVFMTMLDSGVWSEKYTWQHAAVPLVVERKTVPLSQPVFRATLAHNHTGTICGIQCQWSLPAPDRTQLEHLLAYETIYANSTRTLTEVRLEGADESLSNATMLRLPNGQSATGSRRNKREVFGTDGRFVISDRRFTARYPFSASVKLSSGCSGILVAPRHVLTAAHCVHDGKDYLKETRGLRVGVMRERPPRDSRMASQRRGRSRGGGGGGRGDVNTQGRREGSEGKKRRERKNGRGKRRREKSRVHRRAAVMTTTTLMDHDRASFRWTRVKQIHTPRGWMTSVARELAADYDYALLELRRPLGATPMALGLVSAVKETVPASRVHFTGFDNDQPGKAVYRFCSVAQESNDLLYQYCDARAGSSGAGVYVRLRDPGQRGPNMFKNEGKRGKRSEGKWARKVIGVFSGHQWVDENGMQRDYNVAVRITPPKFAQICHWIHGNPKSCQQT